MSMEVLGLGTALPAGKISQVEAAELSSRLIGLSEDQENWLTELYQLTGIKMPPSFRDYALSAI